MNYYKIIKKHEYLLISALNIIRKIYSIFLSHDKRKILNENVMLKDSELDKSCFILVGGLSVKNMNLNDLKKHDIITANHFFRTDDYQRLRPKYHVITDQNFFSEQENIFSLSEKIQDFTTVFLNLRKTTAIEKENIKYIIPLYRVTSNKILHDITKPCSSFSTVTLSCIQIAIFLGYKKIYLVGFDLPPGHMPHYYKDSSIEKQGEAKQKNKIEEFEYCSLYWQYTNCHHEAYKIQNFATRNNIEIFNLSPISSVRAFPAKSLSEI